MSASDSDCPAPGVRVVDGMGRCVELPAPAERVVSLVPSTTESLAVLGRGDKVVGRTRYCVHPAPWVQSVPEVGGTKSPDLERIRALQPDLILANEEENRPELWDELSAIAPLYVAWPRTLDEALDDLESTATLIGADRTAKAFRTRIEQERAALRSWKEQQAAPFRFAYLVWRQPWMAVNAETYISSLLSEAGGLNVFAGRERRYPAVSVDELLAEEPDIVFLPSEPFPFGSEHAAELGALQDRCRLVDGEMLCWHGTRMAVGLPYLADLLA